MNKENNEEIEKLLKELVKNDAAIFLYANKNKKLVDALAD